MKTNLITIYPGLLLESKVWDNGVKVDSNDLITDFSLGKSKVFSYKKIKIYI